MALRPIGPGSTLEDIIRIINENNADIDNKFQTRIVKDENGIPRMISGKLPDGTYGEVISKEGEDVLTVFT